MQPGRAQTRGLGVPLLLLAPWVGWVAPVRPTHGVRSVVSRPSAALGVHVCAVSTAPWCCSPMRAHAVLCVRVLGHLAPLHRCARSVLCVGGAVSWATWLLFTCVLSRCVVLRVQCSGPLCSCSPVCPLGALFWVCGVLGHLAPVHQCARSVRCFACAMSWATWRLFAGVLVWCFVLRVRCPGQLGSCSPVCPLGALCCLCGVLVLLAPV